MPPLRRVNERPGTARAWWPAVPGPAGALTDRFEDDLVRAGQRRQISATAVGVFRVEDGAELLGGGIVPRGHAGGDAAGASEGGRDRVPVRVVAQNVCDLDLAAVDRLVVVDDHLVLNRVAEGERLALDWLYQPHHGPVADSDLDVIRCRAPALIGD